MKWRVQVKFRPVFWGVLIQFVLGLLVLRWEQGSAGFRDASDAIVRFLDYTKNGTDFVYGFLSTPPNICGVAPVFIFTVSLVISNQQITFLWFQKYIMWIVIQVLQVIIYFGAIVAVLYYFGIMQFFLSKIALMMQLTMGTTATESLNAAACIFLGQVQLNWPLIGCADKWIILQQSVCSSRVRRRC